MKSAIYNLTSKWRKDNYGTFLRGPCPIAEHDNSFTKSFNISKLIQKKDLNKTQQRSQYVENKISMMITGSRLLLLSVIKKGKQI